MSGRELRTKLPELRNDKRNQDESVWDCDWNHKLAGKLYADNRRCGKQTTVLPGYRVLLKNSRATGKLATNFEQTSYVVERRDGNELTVRSLEGIAYRRSSSIVKPCWRIVSLHYNHFMFTFKSYIVHHERHCLCRPSWVLLYVNKSVSIISMSTVHYGKRTANRLWAQASWPDVRWRRKQIQTVGSQVHGIYAVKKTQWDNWPKIRRRWWVDGYRQSQ